eukprot:scaffold27408_cov174-Isochrysis_galbana.AAC.1
MAQPAPSVEGFELLVRSMLLPNYCPAAAAHEVARRHRDVGLRWKRIASRAHAVSQEYVASDSAGLSTAAASVRHARGTRGGAQTSFSFLSRSFTVSLDYTWVELKHEGQ